MKSTFLASIVAIGLFVMVSTSVFAKERGPLPPLTEEQAAAGQAKFEINLQERADKYNKYTFRTAGSFLVSKERFASSLEAKVFCESIPGYRLTTGFFHSVLVLMGLPIMELYNTAIVSQPVLGKDGGRTGVAYWFWPDMAKVPDRNKLGAQDLEILKSLFEGDIFAADLDGQSGDGSGVQLLSLINTRLAALQQKPLALHALCEDASLAKALHN